VEIWNQEIAEVWNHEVTEIGNHGPGKLWNHGPAKSCVQIHEIRESWMKDSGIRRKPSQRRYLKSPGLACELVAGL
jgi:hypothetical protein